MFFFCVLSVHQVFALDQANIESRTIKFNTVIENTFKAKLQAEPSDIIKKSNQSTETSKPIQSPVTNHGLSNEIDNMHLLSPGVYFNLDDGWGNYTGNATINFDGNIYAYDPAMGGTLIYCSQGTYSYVVTPADASKAINRGKVTVSSNSLVNVKIEIADAHRIDIYVNDPNSKALQDAMVTFDGVTLLTDETGLASFERYPLGTYTYSVSSPGYISLENQSLDVMAQVEKVRVTLNRYTYTVTFTVKSGTDALEGASISLHGRMSTTDAEGLATFINLAEGAYDYTVSKTGYKDETGSITIADGDVFQNVNLISLTGLDEASVNNVKLYPNPTGGNLYITLPDNFANEATIRITNLIGLVVFENKVSGSSGQINLDISGFDDGVYFVKISGKGFMYKVKVEKRSSAD